MGSRPIRCMCNLEIKENIPCPSYLLVCATLSVELDFVFFKTLFQKLVIVDFELDI